MKRIHRILFLFIVMAGILSCGNKQKSSQAKSSAPEETQTVKDLKVALDGEATASAKYAAFAEQAAKDGFPQLEVMFKATSKAESVHITNHLKALKAAGGTAYKPKVDAFDVKSTAENLKAAIDGETYEFSKMYPKFVKDANDDFEDEAVKSFTYALEAEKVHQKIYIAALANLKHPKKLAKAYFVCPTCGSVYANAPAEVCEICHTTADKFIKFAI